jgi:hypothetical protein
MRRRVVVMEIRWRHEFKRVFKTRERSGQEKRSGKEWKGKERSRQWKLKMVGSHSCRRNDIIALAPLHASGQKKILRHRRVDAIFLTAFTKYSG